MSGKVVASRAKNTPRRAPVEQSGAQSHQEVERKCSAIYDGAHSPWSTSSRSRNPSSKFIQNSCRTFGVTQKNRFFKGASPLLLLHLLLHLLLLLLRLLLLLLLRL